MRITFKIILVAILYYLAARFGYFLAFEGTHALPTWPPTGIGFALIILLGRKCSTLEVVIGNYLLKY